MRKEQILFDNLSLLKKEERHTREKRLYELSVLAGEVATAMEGAPFSAENEEYLRKCGSLVFSSDVKAYDTVMYPTDALENEELADGLSCDAAAFALFLSECLSGKGALASPWREKTGGGRVAYVKTPRADRAYLALAAKRQNVSVVYVENAAAAVQAMLAGGADYALLPYMSAEQTVLSGTAKLIDRHELCLGGVVTLSEGEERFSFALLSPEVAPLLFSADMRLALRLTADSYAHLGRMLSAFSALGYGQTALCAAEEEYGRVHADVTLNGEGDPLALWVYLSLYSVGFSLRGRYPVIEG